MNNLDELPDWAAQNHVPGSNIAVPEPPPQKRRAFRYVLLGLLGLVGVAGVAGLGYLAVTLAASNTSASDTLESAAASDADEPDGANAQGGTDTASGGAQGEGDETDTSVSGDATGESNNTDTDTDPSPDASDGAAASDPSELVDNSDGSIRYSVLKNGQLYLRGRVTTEEYGLAVEQLATAVLGPGKVTNEYEVDPNTPQALGGPVYVEDVVLFEFNSVAIDPQFLPLLDLGITLFVQNPLLEVTIVSRTDAVGSEDINLQVAQQRAEAVVNYWAQHGIDPSRVTIDARGEEDASSDLDESALDRRVEMVIENLFG